MPLFTSCQFLNRIYYHGAISACADALHLYLTRLLAEDIGQKLMLPEYRLFAFAPHTASNVSGRECSGGSGNRAQWLVSRVFYADPHIRYIISFF